MIYYIQVHNDIPKQEYNMTKQELLYIASIRKVVQVNHQVEHNEYESTYNTEILEVGSFLTCANKRIEFYKAAPGKEKIANFSLVADHTSHTFTFGPTGQLGMLPKEYQGRGIGRYCMVHLINELIPQFKEYSVNHGKLSYVDAKDDFSRDNRNNFYIKLGFKIRVDAEKRVGRFICDDPAKLSPNWNHKKVRKLSQHFINKRLIELMEKRHKLTEANAYACRLKESRGAIESEIIKKNAMLWLSLIGFLFYLFMKALWK